MKIHSLLLGTAFMASALSVAAQDNTITVQTKKIGAEIQPTMYGIFFEDINFGADGGLYAELVKNRSFEFTPDHYMGWKMFGNVTLQNDGPFEKNPHYVRLGCAGHGDMWTGIQNEGFFGIGLKKDAEYRFSVWARVPDGNPVTLMVQFIDQNTMNDAQQFVSQDLKIDSKEWKKYTMVMKSNRTIAKANLRIFLSNDQHRSGTGTVDLEHVSLFPVDTWMGHENGMRKDLAQALYTDEKSEIDACINTISVAGHNDLSSSFDLCLSYSELSHDCKTPVEMLHYIEKKFGADKVDAGIDFMFEALSADLASVNQSQEQVLLESVGTSLSLARSINGASVILNGFVERFDKIYHLDSGNLNGFSLLERMLKLSEQKFIQTSQVRSLYTEVSKQDPETEVLMAQDLLNKSRELGSEVFFGVENRAHVIDAVQNLVDKLIEKEDEWLEQGGN